MLRGHSVELDLFQPTRNRCEGKSWGLKPTDLQEYPPGGPQPEVGPTDRRFLTVKEDLARIEDAVFVAERSKLAGEDCFETHRGGRDQIEYHGYYAFPILSPIRSVVYFYRGTIKRE